MSESTAFPTDPITALAVTPDRQVTLTLPASVLMDCGTALFQMEMRAGDDVDSGAWHRQRRLLTQAIGDAVTDD